LYGESANPVVFDTDSEQYSISVSPYVNQMPGAASNTIIVPIEFQWQNVSKGTWPHQFKITAFEADNIKDSAMQLIHLDHNDWMPISESTPSIDVLRIASEAPVESLEGFTIYFKDNQGRKYQVAYKTLTVGAVY
jgi:hypothetical protein